MKKLILLLATISILVSCDTKQTVIDTGVCNPYFEGSIMEYLRAREDGYWDLTIQMIERAGLTDLFEGREEDCPQITFFAPPSYAIQRFMLDSQKDKINGTNRIEGEYKVIEDFTVEQCKDYILFHVVNEKRLKSSFEYKNKDYFISDEQGGGTDLTTIAGNRFRAYVQKGTWVVADVGAESMGLYSLTTEIEIPVATPDIQPRNGVIHALHTGYDFGNVLVWESKK